MAFGATEAEDFGVVADKGDALGGVDRAGAQVAGFDPVSFVRRRLGTWEGAGDVNLMIAEV